MPNIRVTELDFDQIKTNLKEFLKGQDEFTDYDFEGSGLSVLLDILAYNTHYNSYYMNMVAGEAFIDSALKRESAVSIAKHLAYTPRSRRSASARIDILVNNVVGNPSTLTLERYTPFVTTIDGKDYRFVNLEPVSIVPVGGIYAFESVVIKEGIPVINRFTSVNPGTQEKFPIPNKSVDTTTMRVLVQNSATDLTTTAFTRVTDITGMTGETTGYFLEQNQQGLYEIYFGDGAIGRKLLPGNIVIVEYLTCVGDAVNVSNIIAASNIAFELGTDIEGYSDVTVTTIEAPSGGLLEESIDSIKFNAPRGYTAQNRAVTSGDYETLIKQEIQDVDSVVVWGGEDSSPPVYGKVFVSVVPSSGSFITNSIKENIRNTILGTKKMVSTVIEFVEPEYFYVNVNANVKFNTRETNRTAAEIKNLVETSIRNYFEQNLGVFNEPFIYSKLSATIDATDPAIIGNLTTIKLQKRFVPNLTSGNSVRMVFNNILKQGSLETTRFVVAKSGLTIPARIRDIPEASTVRLTGTFRRNGTIITLRFNTPHKLTVGEIVDLEFSTGIQNDEFTVYEVLSENALTVISSSSGTVSGTVTIISKPRGTLQLYNPASLEVIEPYVGFVSYQQGIVDIQALNVVGFTESMTDIRVLTGVEESSKDVVSLRNQIIRLDDSAPSPAVELQSGLTVSTTSTVI